MFDNFTKNIIWTNIFILPFVSRCSDNNFGMTCVIVNMIFIFLLFPNSVIPRKENLKKICQHFEKIVYFNKYYSVYVLGFYNFALFSYDRIS